MVYGIIKEENITILFFFFWSIIDIFNDTLLEKKMLMHDYLLTLLGSVILSLDEFGIMLGGVCESELHWLSTSSDSFFSCCCCFN